MTLAAAGIEPPPAVPGAPPSGPLRQRGTDGSSLPCQLLSGGWRHRDRPHSPLFIDRICGTAA